LQLGKVKNVRSEKQHDEGKAVVVGALTYTPDLNNNSTKAKKSLLKAGTKLTGVLKCSHVQTLAVVLAEGWPSWLEAVLALGFWNMYVWCQDPSLLISYNVHCIFDTSDELLHVSKFRWTMLYVSGSRSFVQRIKIKFRQPIC
jgi:hypothetical protein